MELEQAKPFHELQKPSKLAATLFPRIPAQVLKNYAWHKRQEVMESDGKCDMKDDKTSLEIPEYKH